VIAKRDRSATAEAADGWTPIAPDSLSAWNARLLNTEAHLHQYPYWNEPFRRIHFTPHYLVYRSNGEPVAYVAVLQIGFWPFRVGVIKGGPVSLVPKEAVPWPALNELCAWARKRGYVFLRFSHPDAGFSDRIAELERAERLDAFPVYPHLEYDLIVEQLDDEARMLASFQKIARSDIRNASAVGYEIKAGDDPQFLVESWPLFERLSERKGFRIYNRPMESYLDLVRMAREQGSVRFYMARLNGRLVESIIVVRDGNTAHYVAGALDVEGIKGHTTASPATLLHWNAMRDFYRLGVKYYSFGGTVFTFKKKFRPLRRDFPPPVTVVIRPLLYRVWVGLVPHLQSVGTALRELAARLFAKHTRSAEPPNSTSPPASQP
jgi:hypothetical protein